MIPTGKLTRKTDLHPKLSISGPPISGPNTLAAAKDDDQIPSACARSFPSLKVIAKIAILGTEYFTNRLYENMKFKFCEGNRIIGFGKIIEIINVDLKCESEIDQKTINLNLYPTDIKNRLEFDYGKNFVEAKRRIQELIISNKEFRSERIVRALIYAGNKDIDNLKIRQSILRREIKFTVSFFIEVKIFSGGFR